MSEEAKNYIVAIMVIIALGSLLIFGILAPAISLLVEFVLPKL